MNRKTILIASAVLVAVLVTGFLSLRRPENTPDAPGGTYWLCSNQGCGTEFNLSMRQVADHHKAHYGEPIPCPKCNQPATRAEKCPHCGKVYPAPRTAMPCPSCKKMPTAPAAAT